MRHRVELQQPITDRGDFGEMETTYSRVAVVWADINPNAGRQYYEALQANTEIQGAIRIRYRSDIQVTWRVVYGSRTLQIISIVNPQERNRELLIYYKEAQD